jgi:transposase
VGLDLDRRCTGASDADRAPPLPSPPPPPATPRPPVTRRRAVCRWRPRRRGCPTAGVSRQAASRWHAAWKAGGTNALASRGPTGPTPRLSDAQLVEVEQALRKGAVANGFVGELWTLDRIALVIERLTEVRHHPAWVWALLRYRLGWTVQRPQRRAAERDQAAIDHWVKTDWPRSKKTPGVAAPSSASLTSRV